MSGNDVVSTTPSAAAKNFLPCLTVANGQVWSGCEGFRDLLYDAFQTATAQRKLTALILKSSPGVFPVWVSCEIWTANQERRVTRRGKALMTVTPLPHRRWTQEMSTAIVMDGREHRKVTTRVDHVSQAAIRQAVDGLVAYLTGAAKYPPYLFRWGLEDFLKQIFSQNKIVHFRKSGIRLAMVFCLWTGSVIMSEFLPLGMGMMAVAGMILIGLNAGLWFDKQVRVVDAGRPAQPPRHLTLVDTWYAVLPGLAGSVDEVRSTLGRDLAPANGLPVTITIETIAYWASDAVEEREQIVVTYRRAMLFVHVTPYGRDLYVGWDAHLNHGYWAETDIASGIDYKVSERLRITEVKAAERTPSAYDLIDVNTLTEFAHGRITRLVRQLVEEHRIDQEIDFAVIRRERRSGLIRDTQDSAKTGGADNRRFRRTG